MAKPPRQSAKAKSKRSGKEADSPIGARQRELTEQQEKVKAKMHQLTVMIEDAPGLRKRQEVRRQNIFIKERAQGSRRLDETTLPDTRFESGNNSSPARARKSLKSESRQAKITFFGLLIALVLLALWVWSLWR